MSFKTKESVNRSCECGSGKKWKRCHGLMARTSPSLAAPSDFAAAYAEMSKHEKTRIRRFGHARLPHVRTDEVGRTRIAVGDREFIGDWRGVGDFLIPFVRKKLGAEWFDDQRRRPQEHQHTVMRWDAELRRLRDATPSEIGGGKNVRVTASVFAYFMFAWDLVLIEENGGLPSSLLDRLKDRKRFQGARHEVFVAAVLTRANFRLDYEDESDSSGKHPEMIGVHRGSGQEVAIEAKSRHVHGVLDYRADSGRRNGGFNVTSLLRKAFRKPTGGRPFVVFLDLNVPPSTYPLRESGIGEKVRDAADSLTTGGPSPYNLVIVTNLALHYAEGSLVFPKKGNFILKATNPLVRPKHPAVLRELVRQTVDYGKFLPRTFEDLGLMQPRFLEQRRTR